MEKGISFVLLPAKVQQSWFLPFCIASLWMCHKFRHCPHNWKMLTKIQKTDARFRVENRTWQQPGVSPTWCSCVAWVGSWGDKSTESWEENGVNSSVTSTLPAWPCVPCQLFCRQWTCSFCLSLAFCSLALTLLCQGWQISSASSCEASSKHWQMAVATGNRKEVGHSVLQPT